MKITAMHLSSVLREHPCTAWRINDDAKSLAFANAVIERTYDPRLGGSTGVLILDAPVVCSNCKKRLI